MSTGRRSWDRGSRVHDHSSLMESGLNVSSVLNNSGEDVLELRHWGLPDTVLARYAMQGVERMFEWQARCLMVGRVIEGEGNLVYSAPTSAGKTLVAELLLIKKVVETRQKALLILPFVSIAREKVQSLKKLLSECHVRVNGFLGSQAPPGGMARTDVAVCTIEKANGLVNRMLEEKTMDKLGIVVVDELHMVGDPSRGYLLELLLTKIRFMSMRDESCSTQIIGMSATLPNLDLLAEWLDADLFRTDFRPVPLHECIKMGSKLYSSNFEEVRQIRPDVHIPGDSDHLIYLCLEPLLKGHSVLVFCPTKDWCEKLAETISKAIFDLGKATLKMANAEDNSLSAALRKQLNGQKLSEVIEQLKRSPAGLDPSLGRCISFGVSYHHAGLTMEERDVVEGAFKNMVLRILVATSTLSSGVNLPARRVILRSPFKFQRQPLDSMTYKQMIGRAGRKGIDDEGESILFCREIDRSIVSQLVSASLPPVRSCLVRDNSESLATALKRAVLEVVASGIAQSLDDVEKYASCTMLAASIRRESESNTVTGLEKTKTPISECLDFLRDNEFVRLQEHGYTEDGGKSTFVPTQLGQACLSSSLPPDEGLKVFKELERARRCFVLENELHILYQIVPINATLKQLNWITYLSLWQSLSSDMRRVGDLVGVEERFLVRAVRGTICWEKHERSSAIHHRFYTALALNELVNEAPLAVVARKYGCSKGELQSLMQLSSIYAGMVTMFCRRLGWLNLELLLGQFQERIEFGVQRELIDLCRLDALNGQRARVLFRNGFESVALLANAEAAVIETVLHNAQPFESKKKVDGESSMAMTRRNALRAFWLTGQKGLTLSEAAELIVQEAREMLQKDLGVPISWDPSERERTDSLIKEHDSKRRSGRAKKRKGKRKCSSKRVSNATSITVPKKQKREEYLSITSVLHQSTIGTLVAEKKETNRMILEDVSRISIIKNAEDSETKETECKAVKPEANYQEGSGNINNINEDIANSNEVNNSDEDVFDDSFVYDLPSILPSSHLKVSKPTQGSQGSCPRTPALPGMDNLEFSITPNITLPAHKTATNKEDQTVQNCVADPLVTESFLEQMFDDDDPFGCSELVSAEEQKQATMSPVASKKMPLESEQRSRLRHRESTSNRRRSKIVHRTIVASPECIIFSSDDDDDESDKEVVNENFNKVKSNNGVEEVDESSEMELSQDDFCTKFITASRVSLSLAVMPSNESQKKSNNKEAIGAKIMALKKRRRKSDFNNAYINDKPKLSLSLDNGLEAHGIVMAYEEKNDVNSLKTTTLLFSDEIATERFKELLRNANRQVVLYDARRSIRQLSSILVEVPQNLELWDILTALWMLEPDVDCQPLPKILRTYVLQRVQQDQFKAGDETYSLNLLEKPIRDLESCLQRAELIALTSLSLMDVLEAQLVENGLLKSFRDVEMPLLTCLVRLELNGVGLDEAECQRQTSIVRGRMEEIELQAHKLAKRSFRLSSPAEVCQVLYKDLRLPINGEPSLGLLQSPRRARGRRQTLSSGKDTLLKLSELHQLPKLIMEWRKLDVALNKIVLPMQRCKLYHSALSHPRVYIKSLSRSGTGRLALQEPNMHCIPRDFELNFSDNKALLIKALGSHQAHCLKRNLDSNLDRSLMNFKDKLNVSFESNKDFERHVVSLRHAVVSAENFVLVCADYSQIELRILAHLSEDDTLCDWLRRTNFDVFKAIASEIGHKEVDQVSNEDRQQAKQICYGLIYGMGLSTLSSSLGISESQAQLFMDAFHNRFPRIQAFIDETVEKCRRDLLVRTMDNRLRRMPHINDSNEALRAAEERKAVNTVVQGSAADLVNRAMIAIDKELHSQFPASRLPIRLQKQNAPRTPGAYLLLQMHDELIYEVSSDALLSVCSIVKRCMERACRLRVATPVKIKVGPSWANVKDIDISKLDCD